MMTARRKKRKLFDDFERLPAPSAKRSQADNSGRIAAYKRLLAASLETLTEIERRQITMYYLQGHKCSEIAEVFGTSVATVSRNIKRAREKLVLIADLCEKSGLFRGV